MDDRMEKLRAGIALCDAAARLLDQAKTEFGGALESDIAVAWLREAAITTRGVAAKAVVEYDRQRKP